MNLALGEQWQQSYMGLKYHMEEALIENNLYSKYASSCPQVALFSKKYYNEINDLDHNKVYDYCFIGSINDCYEKRIWVINFVKKYFTSNSIFINTYNDPNWKLLGDYDKSNKNLGFNPKKMINNQSKKAQYRVIEENKFYFQTMCQSKFVLCPSGDGPWSFRFYETLMCKSIPIVETYHHTYRTKEESKIKYQYILSNNIEQNKEIPYDDLVNKNTLIFNKFHLLDKYQKFFNIPN